MFYAIDMDSLKVESKSEDGEILATYILDNDLSLAVVLIDSEDELMLQLNLKEMQGLSKNLGSNKYHTDEEMEAQQCWDLLGEHQDNFPKFTKALGKRLLKQTPKEAPQKSSAKAKPKTNTSNRVKAKDLIGMTFNLGTNTPRNGTSFCIFTDFIDDNLGEATFDELVEIFIEEYKPKNPNKPVDSALGRAYVRDAVNAGYIEEGL